MTPVLMRVAAQNEPDEPAAFEATVREALSEFQAGRWTEARTLFLEAHAIRPSAEALRMAGNASYEAREYVRAVELLERALAEDRSPLREEHVALARDAFAAASRFVTRLELVTPRDARVRIDGVIRNERPIVVLRGERLVEVSAVGFETRRERVVLTAAERTLTVELHPTTPVATPTVVLPPTERERDETEPEPSRTWIWVVVGVVAASVIAGLAVGLVVRDRSPEGANAPDRVVRALGVQ